MKTTFFIVATLLGAISAPPVFALPGQGVVGPISPSYFSISADGQEVTDARTGLIWRRCAEGMVFSAGTCTGTTTSFVHEAALQHAATQARSTGVAWRLPNIKELSSIADKTRINPAIDSVAFPATPVSVFWSASPYVDSFSFSTWVVSFGDGYVSNLNRNLSYYVRLVRIGISGIVTGGGPGAGTGGGGGNAGGGK